MDVEIGNWEVLVSLGGYDGVEILYDSGKDFFVLIGVCSCSGEIVLVNFDKSIDMVLFEVCVLSGFIDFYVYLNVFFLRFMLWIYDG